MFRATVTGLTASTSYRYYVQGATNSTAGGGTVDFGTTNSGAGNSILLNTAGTTYSTSGTPGLSTAGSYQTFTTDGSGNYTGWFGFVNTGNARFTAGNTVYPSITINSGGSSTTVGSRRALDVGITVFAYSASAGATNGSFLKSASSGTAKNIVALYDNVTGTGRPIYVTYIESTGITNTTSGFSTYGTSAGNWGALIPNALANGVRRIEQFSSSTGNSVNDNQDADGTWTTGSIITTTSSNGLTAKTISGTDAPLNVATTVVISSPNPAVSAATLSANSTNNPIYRFDLDATNANATLSSLDVTTSGSYVSADVSNMKLWYQSSSTFNSGTATLLSTIATPGVAGSKTFSTFTRQIIASSSTGYFFITIDIASSITSLGSTLGVSAVTTSKIGLTSSTSFTGSTNAGGTQTIGSSTPSITLSSANPAVAAADLATSATKQPVYKFTTAVTTANATLNSVAFTTTNTSASDITKYQLWYNSTDNLGTATQIGSDITASLGSGSRTFSSLTQAINSGNTGYFWITVDVASGATAGNTLVVSAITTSDLTFASGTKSGTASAGGTQTFVTIPGAPTLGTITPGNQELSCAFTPGTTGGSTISNYEFSTNGGTGWTTRSPASTSSPIVITSLTNGTTYDVKIRAVNAAGSGTASSMVQGTPRTTPGAPNINTITPGNQQLQVAFTAPASNGGSSITDYEYSTDNGSNFKSSGTTSSPYTITTESGSSSSLTNGVQYSIVFRAVNAAGAGTSSTMVTGTPASGCTAPSTQASGLGTSSVTDVSATVSWTRGNGDNVLVLVKSGSAVNSSPSSGTSYSANAAFGSGSQLGTGNYVVYAGTGTSVALTGLTTGVTYHVAVIEYNNTGTCYSSSPLTGNFTTKSLPSVSTSAASGVGLTSATLNGNVTNDGGYSVTRGFVYSSINTSPTLGGSNVTDVSSGTGTGTFSSSPTLTQNTTYYYQAYATNSLGTTYGGVQNFSTLKSEPTAHVTSFAIGTLTTTNIPVTWTAASPNPDGYLLRVSSSSVTDPTDGVAVSDDADVSDGTGAINLTGSASSYSSFTGFAAGTTYTYKIYSYNNSGSNVDYLVTGAPSANSVLLPASPSTPTFSLVTQNSFTITWGSVTGASSYRLDLSDNSGFSTYVSGYQDLTVNSTSQAITGLSANTTYYARVRAVNSAGTGANSSNGSQTTLCTPTDVTSLAGTNGSTQSVVTYTLPACSDEILIVAKPTSSVSASPSGDGTAYTANAAFGSGTAFDGTGRVVYKGVGTSVTITGLANGTTYYIKAFTREGSQWSSGTEVSVMPTIPVTLWSNTGASTAWYTSGNWNPSKSSSAWLTSDVAHFQNSGSATTAGINMNTASLSIGGIEISGSRTRGLTVGNSTATAGTLTLNGTIVNGNQNVILRNNSNSLLTLQNNETGTGKTMNIAIANSTNNIIYIDSSGGISISSIISGSSKSMTLSGSGTGKLTLSAANTYSGGFNLNSGRSINIDNNAALGTGTFTINGGTVDATTSARTITNAMVIAGSFRYTGSQNLTQTTGAITLNATPTIILSANTISLGGIISGSFGITKSGNGTLELTGGNTFSGLTSVSEGKLIFNRTGGTTIPSTNDVSVSGGTLQISTNQTINDLTLSGGTLQVDAGATLTINGAYTGGGTIVNNGKIVITAASAFPGSSTTISAMKDLEVNRSAGLSLDKNLSVTGTLTLTSGTLNIGSQTLTLGGGVARTSGTIDAATGTIVFTNVVAQTLPSSLFSGNINNLTLNGSGGITLGNAPTLSGTLTLTSGILTTTATNLLTLSDGAAVSGASNSSFVHGPIQKVGNANFTFPVGSSGTGYQPIQIANFSGTTASTDAFTAEYKRSSATGVGTNINSPVNRVSFCEYWQLDRSNGTPAVDVTLNFNSNSGCGGGSAADYLVGRGGSLSELRVCRWDGTQWVNYTTAYSGTAPNVTLTASAVSSFSPFTVGATGLAPLPLKLLSFKGVKKSNKVNLEWITTDEREMKEIEVYRSKDGENMDAVGQLASKGEVYNRYSFTDSSTTTLNWYQLNQNVYYRLKLINLDKSYEWSDWINVMDSDALQVNHAILIYPNPTSSGELHLLSRYPNNTINEVRIYDMAGKLVYLNEVGGLSQYSIDLHGFNTGMYSVRILLNHGLIENYRLMVQF